MAVSRSSRRPLAERAARAGCAPGLARRGHQPGPDRVHPKQVQRRGSGARQPARVPVRDTARNPAGPGSACRSNPRSRRGAAGAAGRPAGGRARPGQVQPRHEAQPVQQGEPSPRAASESSPRRSARWSGTSAAPGWPATAPRDRRSARTAAAALHRGSAGLHPRAGPAPPLRARSRAQRRSRSGPPGRFPGTMDASFRVGSGDM